MFYFDLSNQNICTGKKSWKIRCQNRSSKVSVAHNENRKNSKVINKDKVYDIKDFQVKKSGCGETFVINFNDDDDDNVENNKNKKKPLRLLQKVRPKPERLKSASSTLTSSSSQVKKSSLRPKKKNHASKERGGQGGKKTLHSV